MSIYPAYRERRSSWTAPFGGCLVVLDTDDGLRGFGQADGGRLVQEIVEGHLARILVGQDLFDIELLWDQMFRASLPYGRKGLTLHAISGVDSALWDLAGKALGQPVYRLLGGKTKDSLPVYATTNDPADWADATYFGIKLAMPHGPADGREGALRNRDLVRACRDAIGEVRDIMLDCYMAWDVEYTLRMLDLVEPLGVRWVEEVLPPDDLHGYERLARYSGPVAIATGEHEYTRWGHRSLIETGAISVLQPDVHWVGGITEARKICAMASAWGLQVVPHGGGLQAAGQHLSMSQVVIGIAEWVRTWDRATGRPEPLIGGIPDPVDGRIRASDEPGLGIVPNEELLAPL
jgi:L-rhamnonate dehydratase